jgi:hypothetical protein
VVDCISSRSYTLDIVLSEQNDKHWYLTKDSIYHVAFLMSQSVHHGDTIGICSQRERLATVGVGGSPIMKINSGAINLWPKGSRHLLLLSVPTPPERSALRFEIVRTARKARLSYKLQEATGIVLSNIRFIITFNGLGFDVIYSP